jgi:competence protein ComEC
MPYISLALAVALVTGLAGGVLVDRPIALASSLILSAAWATAMLAYLRGLPRLQLTAVMLLVCGAGWILGTHAVDRALHSPLRLLLEQRIGGFEIEQAGDGRLEEPLLIEGRLRDDAAPTEAGAMLSIAVERIWIGSSPEPTSGGISVGVGGAMHAEHLSQWTRGRLIRAPVLLRRPARYFNHGLPDHERAMARRGTTLVGTIKSASLVDVVGDGVWWEEAAARVRARTREALARHVRPRSHVEGVGFSPAGGRHESDQHSTAIATAILIGDRAGLDPEVERRLQEAGTYHVIAISGGNVAILAGILFASFASLGLRGRVAVLGTIAALTAYAVIASGGASVARATLMAVVYLAVRLIDQRTAAANAIGLTGAVLLLIDPMAIADVGFWLTFGATAAIVAGVSRAGTPSSSWLRAVWIVLLASVCAELALAPVAATIFQRVTFAGLLLNFIALPAMTLVQIAATVVVVCHSLGAHAAATPIGHVVHLASTALTESARFVDHAPWLTWRVPSPAVVVTMAYYVALVAAFVAFTRRSPVRTVRGLATGVAAAAFLWIVTAPQARVRAYGDGQLHLTMVDVGQGDAMLVTFPNGRQMIVDTGGLSVRSEFDIGDRVIGPTLRARHLLSVDYVLVTHGDADHLGGARSLVRDFEPREIWWGVPVANHQPAGTLRAEADRVRAAWRTLQRGDRIEIGSVELRVHHPPLPDWERQRVRNNDSVVLELRLGDVSMLLTGDIAREVEYELLSTLDLLPTVVLKVAHHGSGTSTATEFVEKVKPAVAIIGVGRGNTFGHPVPYVLERLERVGADIFRTDLDGEIEAATDGTQVWVTTWSGRRVVR